MAKRKKPVKARPKKQTAPAIKRGKRGPLPMSFTNEQRAEVQELAGLGGRDEDIADHLGLACTTLKKHFRRELDMGRFIANQSVKKTAFNMATSGKDTAMTIFWLKTRCGWKETSVVQVQDLPAIEVN